MESINTPEGLINHINKSFDNELKQKLEPQHTEIKNISPLCILQQLAEFDLKSESKKIKSFIRELYPDKKNIPDKFTRIMNHLSHNDNDYYEKWLSILEQSLIHPLIEEFNFKSILEEWYYIEKLYLRNTDTAKVLYYSGWILNILLQFQNTKIYYTHNIFEMVKKYNNLIINKI